MKTTRSNQIFHVYDGDNNGNERTVSKTETKKMNKGDGMYVTNESTGSNSYSYRSKIRTDTKYPFTFKGFKIN